MPSVRERAEFARSTNRSKVPDVLELCHSVHLYANGVCPEAMSELGWSPEILAEAVRVLRVTRDAWGDSRTAWEAAALALVVATIDEYDSTGGRAPLMNDHREPGHEHRASYAGDGCDVCDEILLTQDKNKDNT